MGEEALFKLVNPPISLEWCGEKYLVKSASLMQVVLYQQRAKTLIQENDPSADVKLLAYCLYLLLSEVKPGLTEDDVLKNTPGNLDVMSLFVKLGFLNPAKITTATPVVKQTTTNSSVTSPTEQDGLQQKSVD
jgi:hypothetical protein